MIPGSGAVAFPGVVPVIHAGTAHMAEMGVILHPNAFVLCDLHELLHAALGPGVLRDPGLYVCRAHRGRAIGVFHLHFVAAGQGLVAVVDLQDLQVLGAALGGAHPCVDNVGNFLPQLVLCHW